VSNSGCLNDQTSNNNDSNGDDVHELNGVSSGDKLGNQRSNPGDKGNIEETGIHHDEFKDQWEGLVSEGEVHHSREGYQRAKEELSEDNHHLSSHEIFRQIGDSVSVEEFVGSNGKLVSVLEGLIGVLRNIDNTNVSSFQESKECNEE